MTASQLHRSPASGNAFLASLPETTRARLHHHLIPREMGHREQLATPDAPIDEVIFPIRSLLSTVMHTLEGSAVEVALTGHEGFNPLPLAFGSRTSPHTTVVQIPGAALSMSAAAFLSEVAHDAELKERVRRYAEYSFIAATQFAMCNRMHGVEERFARRILMADDRAGTAQFGLTQEYAAQMLGVRRGSVAGVALALGNAHLISYTRGLMAVLDRPALEEIACECYAAVNEQLRQLMGYGPRQLLIEAVGN